MTIDEVVTMVDRLKPNQYEYAQKLSWLSKLDGQIFHEVILTHEGAPAEAFEGYDGADTNIELMVPSPYDEDVYNLYLQSCIDRENGEMGKYNQSITLFSNAYLTFCNWYNRTHMPLPKQSMWIY